MAADSGYGSRQDHRPPELHDAERLETISWPQYVVELESIQKRVQELNGYIVRVGPLHQRALSSPSAVEDELNSVHSQVWSLNWRIRDAIRECELDAFRSSDTDVFGSVRNKKLGLVIEAKNKFERELRIYQDEEIEFQERYREHIARQYQLVSPDADEAELRQAAGADWSSDRVLTAAARSSGNPQAKSVLAGVRERHEELRRIEASLRDLSVLFTDLAEQVNSGADYDPSLDRSAMSTRQGNRSAAVSPVPPARAMTAAAAMAAAGTAAYAYEHHSRSAATSPTPPARAMTAGAAIGAAGTGAYAYEHGHDPRAEITPSPDRSVTTPPLAHQAPLKTPQDALTVTHFDEPAMADRARRKKKRRRMCCFLLIGVLILALLLSVGTYFVAHGRYVPSPPEDDASTTGTASSSSSAPTSASSTDSSASPSATSSSDVVHAAAVPTSSSSIPTSTPTPTPTTTSVYDNPYTHPIPTATATGAGAGYTIRPVNQVYY